MKASINSIRFSFVWISAVCIILFADACTFNKHKYTEPSHTNSVDNGQTFAQPLLSGPDLNHGVFTLRTTTDPIPELPTTDAFGNPSPNLPLPQTDEARRLSPNAKPKLETVQTKPAALSPAPSRTRVLTEPAVAVAVNRPPAQPVTPPAEPAAQAAPVAPAAPVVPIVPAASPSLFAEEPKPEVVAKVEKPEPAVPAQIAGATESKPEVKAQTSESNPKAPQQKAAREQKTDRKAEPKVAAPQQDAEQQRAMLGTNPAAPNAKPGAYAVVLEFLFVFMIFMCLAGATWYHRGLNKSGGRKESRRR